uniref:Uncharacterized protein n=1 Tax=Arundo donax TaxID=35708 RepID=A0A0A8Z8N8_ARUDO
MFFRFFRCVSTLDGT